MGKPFLSGNPGRPRGALNKRSVEFRAILEKHDFCSASALLELFADAKKSMESASEEARPQYLKIAADIAKELAAYSYPKLKAIEYTGHNPLDDMTPAQKLEAARSAVQMFELQVKANDGRND